MRTPDNVSNMGLFNFLLGGHAGITILPLLSKTKPTVSFTDEELEQLIVWIQNGGTEAVEAKAEKEVSAQLVETNPPTEDMNPETQVPPSLIFDDSSDAEVAYNDSSKSKRQREEDGGESDEVSKK
ncbi:hypothetical protein Goklo_019454 [Gossypium klotzschianum]|uniref:Lactate/malate dehydrogenase C-terminal domain-containing protein n=1 Tax=Gossypium klotzschianum TaxID=34286 RepID=A0A7J8UNS5_9ROSI|nr:hypothetical protein [Gossypium klotzschianum]